MPALTADLLDQMFETIAKSADANMRRDGYLAFALTGVSRRGPVASVLGLGDEPPRLDPTGILVVPFPLAGNVAVIRDYFRSRDVEAAFAVMESWRFPDDDMDAARAYLDGSGPPPSAHPRRTEGVAVLGFWPLGGWEKYRDYRIVRTPGQTYLRPSDRDKVQPGDLTMAVSWVEECLPAPDDPDRR
jgi:hypothetical protein